MKCKVRSEPGGEFLDLKIAEKFQFQDQPSTLLGLRPFDWRFFHP